MISRTTAPIEFQDTPTTSRGRGFGLWLAGTTLLCCFAACGGKEADAAATAKAAELKTREPARVRTVAVEQRSMPRVLTTTTVVESEKEIKVFPRASGLVVDVKVEEGDAVEAGGVLAVLDQRQTKTAIEEALVALKESEDNIRKSDLARIESESRIEQTRLKWDQAIRDFERNDKARLISEQALDGLRVSRDTAKGDHETAKLTAELAAFAAKAALTLRDKAELVVKRAQLEDSHMSILAPFAGVIATRSIRVGDSVGPAAAAFVLTDAENLRCVIHRPQRELALFAEARPASGPATSDDKRTARPTLEIQVLAEALPGRTFRGEIQLVSPSIDPQSGSFRVTVRLVQDEREATLARLLPGMLVRLEIITDRHENALVVPKRALRREGEDNVLFVVRESKSRRLLVDEGYSDGPSVEVLPREGHSLAANERVIVVGNRELEDDTEVAEEKAVEPEIKVPQAEKADRAAVTTHEKG